MSNHENTNVSNQNPIQGQVSNQNPIQEQVPNQNPIQEQVSNQNPIQEQVSNQNPIIQPNDELFSYLFAVRVSFQDVYESESDIIRELKKHLLETGTEQSELNTLLHNFYSQYGINIPIETIQEVDPNNNLIVNNMLGFVLNELDYEIINDNINQPEQQNDDDNEDSDPDNEVQLPNEIHTHASLTNLINSVIIMTGLNPVMTMAGQTGYIQIVQPNYQNVVVTVDDNELENIESKQLVSNSDINCSVCMGKMIKEEFVSELKCTHVFHTDCIKPYLSKYNYKCPICRSEVGKPKYNI